VTDGKINRRDIVFGSAAAATFMALPALPGMAHAAGENRMSKSLASGCARRHSRISMQLGRMICENASDEGVINRAMATASCPDCGTRISWDRHAIYA